MIVFYIYSTLDEIKIKKPKDLVIMNCRDNTITRMQYNSGNFFACQEMKDTSVIFHSNVFDRNRYNNQEVFYGVKDISFNGLLKQISNIELQVWRMAPKFN